MAISTLQRQCFVIEYNTTFATIISLKLSP
jgi:hypothetical protein